MNGFSILMFIFGFMIFIAGFILYLGKKDEVLLWKVYNLKKMSKKEVSNIGKWTMISGIVPIIVGIISLILGWE